MLSIIRYIKTYGLEKAVSDFKLKMRDYGHKVHLKYNQLESDMSLQEVQDCRGLILEKGTWDVISLSFLKFFNHGEINAHKIDWDTALILEKMDGSMMQVYWDKHLNKWCVATTGTGEGEGEVNNKMGTTFADLFWETINKYEDFNITKLDTRFTYVFELTSPYNIVVKPHGVSGVTLLTIRSNKSLIEFSYDNLRIMAALLGVPVVEAFDLNKGSFEYLAEVLADMPWEEEGYVVMDANFNRVKIKNPAYCAVHHLKGKSAEHNIMVIIKTNEIEEFAATFPDRREELYRLKDAYDMLIMKLTNMWNELLKPQDDSPAEKKRFALEVFELTKNRDAKEFSGLFFNLHNGKTSSISEYMLNFDDKRLYKML